MNMQWLARRAIRAALRQRARAKSAALQEAPVLRKAAGSVRSVRNAPHGCATTTGPSDSPSLTLHEFRPESEPESHSEEVVPPEPARPLLLRLWRRFVQSY